MDNFNKNKKVFVGMSGGVDSSVSAALLKKKGFNVTGVFIKAWHPSFLECNWQEEKRDAMRVCASLGIPFLMFDLEKEYKKEIVDLMIKEYKKGRTPNPDVDCNKYIKFGLFFKKARAMGADFIATGHYAQIKKDMNNKYGVYRSKDKNKDQTYFLWTIKKKILEKVIFPIGYLEKNEVRKIARNFNLITSDKKDSQGLCFLGKVDMKSFLKKYIKSKKGDILDLNGKKIGKHDGAIFYTLGQRHGFSINIKKPDQKPLYIVHKDIKKNTITVDDSIKNNFSNTLKVIIRNTNWIDKISSSNSYTIEVVTRYRKKGLKCKVKTIDRNKAEVFFKKNDDVLSPGQSIVLYKKDKCLGGGIIEKTF